MEVSYLSDTATTTAIGSLLAGLTAVGGAALLVPTITNRIFPSPKETHLSDFLPFEAIGADGITMHLKNGALTRYYVIRGVDQSFFDHDGQRAAASYRKSFLDGLSEIGAIARIFTQRRQINVTADYEYPNETAGRVAQKWNSQFTRAYGTINVIALTAKNITKLEEAQQVLENNLGPYGVYYLSQNPETNPERITLTQFLGSIASPVTKPAPIGIGFNVADAISADVVWFRPDGILEFSNGSAKKYASIIGIKKLGDDTSITLTTELCSQQMEMMVSRFIEPMGKAEALIRLEQHRKLAVPTTFSGGVNQQFAQAMGYVEAIDENKAALCNYSIAVIVFGNSVTEVETNETIIRGIIASNGATPVRETGASQAVWFNQFPTLNHLARGYKLFTYNIAYDYLLDKTAGGLANSDWGPGPIATFRTASNTIYQHQFHISEEQDALGHGVVIAPSGSGKTVFMEFLSLMASRHRNVKHFFFDRYQGTAIYNLAMGGRYLSMNNDPLPWSVRSGMNPFDCDATEGNKIFLKNWIASITGVEGHEAAEEISDAVEISFEMLEREQRSLSSIYEAGFSPGSKIKHELTKWINPTQYGPIFNAEKDSIELDGNWLTAFDMTQLMEDPQLAGATVGYLMHKIKTTMIKHNAPGFIFIDETEPLLQSASFRHMFRVMLQEFRKVKGVVISVFQRPEALAASGVSQLIRSQSGTYYLFQNPGAKASDYAEFELTEKELDYILGRSAMSRKSKRSVLIKKPMTGESVVLDIDLKRIGPHIKIFSSSSSDVRLVSSLYRQFEGLSIERYLENDGP